MENFDNLQKNRIADDELDQITGGKSFFDIFTTEFRGTAKNPVTLEMPVDEKDTVRATTLEMRSNPLEPADPRKTKKVFKL